MLAGPIIPPHEYASKPGSPASATVGNSGSDGTRFALPTPSARTRPLFTSGRIDGMLLHVSWASPDSTATIAGAVPLYGTCRIFTLPIELKSSAARCAELPAPGDEYEIWPGFARASATSSFTFFTGSDGCE